MYSSKSFCNIDLFLSNTPGQNSSVGELTTYAKTFTRELGMYQDPARTGYTLFNFASSDDSTDAKVEMDFQLVNQAIALSHFITNKANTTSGEIYADELLNDLLVWGSANGATHIEVGKMNSHNGKWMPDWVKWKSAHVTNDNENTVWYAIEAFVTQYSDYEIVVVPPVDNLDVFFTSGSNVENVISAITLPQTIDRIQFHKGGNPETIVRSDDYNYVNPLNSAHRVNVSWPILIYGPAGNNIDAIKDAMVSYILANSSRTRQEWTTIFPDIFKRTEFIMVPHWYKMAIPNMVLQQGIYSPVSNPQAVLELMTSVAVDYSEEHVANNTEVLAHPYRSLTMSVVGSAENRDALYRISQVFPDYISVSSTSIEFNRMNPATQAWVLIISEMIILAETMNEYTTVPASMMKMKRGNLLYVVKTYNNIQYLVLSKRSLYELLGLNPETGLPV